MTAAHSAAKLASYDRQALECLEELAKWPNGVEAMCIGPLTTFRLMYCRKRGWAAKTPDLPPWLAKGPLIWRLTFDGAAKVRRAAPLRPIPLGRLRP